jgi:hypothetical protein
MTDSDRFHKSSPEDANSPEEMHWYGRAKQMIDTERVTAHREFAKTFLDSYVRSEFRDNHDAVHVMDKLEYETEFDSLMDDFIAGLTSYRMRQQQSPMGLNPIYFQIRCTSIGQGYANTTPGLGEYQRQSQAERFTHVYCTLDVDATFGTFTAVDLTCKVRPGSWDPEFEPDQQSQ